LIGSADGSGELGVLLRRFFQQLNKFVRMRTVDVMVALHCPHRPAAGLGALIGVWTMAEFQKQVNNGFLG
jgi:hypothetical protein